jgi:RimJ/RimL family protein N-acetyltransferase
MRKSAGWQPIPILETERLILRGHKLEDFSFCAAMWKDPLVTKHIGGKPFTEQETWTKLLRYLGHWEVLGFGYWAVEEKASGNFVGEMGFADFKREIVPSIQGIPELGWVLNSDAHGKGYATEALKAIQHWGDSHFKESRTVCIIDSGNINSIRVAEKLSYKELQRTTYSGHPTILYFRDK